MRDITKIRLQEYANENFRNYPESYPIKDGLATTEAVENAQELGILYFKHRETHEILRDDELGITQIDYVEWVMEEFSVYVQNIIA